MSWSWENAWNANRFVMSLQSYMFLLIVMLFVYLWSIFVGQNIDRVYGDIQFWLGGVSLFTLIVLVPLSIASGRLSRGDMVFFPSGGTSLKSSILSILLAVAVGGAFAWGTLSFSPLKPFSFSFSLGLGSVSDFFNVGKYFVNFAIVPAMTEELVFGGIFLVFFVFLTLVFNRGFDVGRAKAILFISLVLVSATFAFEHYYAYSVKQGINFNAYQSNPESWAALNPSAPIPADPNSFTGLSQILSSIAVAGIFRLVNTLVILVSGDIYQGIKNHALVNSFVLVLDNSLPTFGQWLYLVPIIFFLFLLDYLENQVAKAGAQRPYYA